MDAMLQIKIIGIDSRGLFVPTRIERMTIDPKKHYDILSAVPVANVQPVPVTVYNEVNVIR